MTGQVAPGIGDYLLRLLDIQDQIFVPVHHSLHFLSLLSLMRPTTVVSSAYLMMRLEADVAQQSCVMQTAVSSGHSHGGANGEREGWSLRCCFLLALPMVYQ